VKIEGWKVGTDLELSRVGAMKTLPPLIYFFYYIEGQQIPIFDFCASSGF